MICLFPIHFPRRPVNNFNSSPPFGLYDITDYDKQGLAAYKSFDNYRFFNDGYVESLLTAQLNQEGVHVYIAKLRLFMKIKTDEERSTTISGLFLRVEVQTEVAYFRQDGV